MGMAAKDHKELKEKNGLRIEQDDCFHWPRVADEATIGFQGKNLRSLADDGKLSLARFLSKGKACA
jgi:hypothetical protein